MDAVAEQVLAPQHHAFHQRGLQRNAEAPGKLGIDALVAGKVRVGEADRRAEAGEQHRDAAVLELAQHRFEVLAGDGGRHTP